MQATLFNKVSEELSEHQLITLIRRYRSGETISPSLPLDTLFSILQVLDAFQTSASWGTDLAPSYQQKISVLKIFPDKSEKFLTHQFVFSSQIMFQTIFLVYLVHHIYKIFYKCLVKIQFKGSGEIFFQDFLKFCQNSKNFCWQD